MSDQNFIESEKYKLDASSEPFIISVSVLNYFYRIIGVLILAYITYSYFSEIPQSGIKLYKLLGMNDLPKGGLLFIKKLLNSKVAYATLSYPFYILFGLYFLTILYWIVLAKTTFFKITYKFIEYRHGLINRKIDNIDLIHVQDHEMHTNNLIDRPLGLSNLKVTGRDASHPELWMKGLKYKDAVMMMEYIRANNYQNYTDYRIDRDKSSRRKKQDSNNYIPGSNGDEGEA